MSEFWTTFWTDYGPIFNVVLTLCILSYLYRDNPFYKFAEHLYLGVSAGYALVIEIQQTVMPNLISPLFGAETDLSARLLLLFPLLLSLLMFGGLDKRTAWLSSIPVTFIVGMYAGATIIGFGISDLMLQLKGSMLPLKPSAEYLAGGTRTVLDNFLVLTGLICTLLFFFFSRPHEGALGVASKIGIWFLMVSFGASFGFTVMGRISLAVGRAQELKAYPLTTAAAFVVIATALAFLTIRDRNKPVAAGAGDDGENVDA